LTGLLTARLLPGVLSCCWTEAGLLVSGGEDHLVRVWDPACARSIATLPGHNAEVTAVAATDDLIVSGGDDKVVCFFAPFGKSQFRVVDEMMG
jgi:WD40 repeat protein